MRRRLRIGIVGATGTWHGERLADAVARRGHEVVRVPGTQLHVAVGGGDGAVRVSRRGEPAGRLDDCDAVLVRGVPRGSLEQVVHRLDALHLLEALGVHVLNAPRAIERTIDKLLAVALLARAGVPTPRTVGGEKLDDALAAFDALGGDVVVKPVFGAMGNGIVRVDDRDVAFRVFRALDLERAVFYLQETIHDPARPRRDLRVLVLDGRVVGAIEREVEPGEWRANLARGARARPVVLGAEAEALAVRAAAVLGVDCAGVDLLESGGRDADGGGSATLHVVEVNGIPGWRGLQAATGVDVAELLVDRVQERLA